MNEILEKLSGGDLRSEGRADEVALSIIQNPSLLADLRQGLSSADKVLRARTCMTLEIISRTHAELLIEVVPQLVELASTDTVPQSRWHLAEIFGNVPLAENTGRVIRILFEYLRDKSMIVSCCAVQTLGSIGKDSPLRREIIQQVNALDTANKSLMKVVTMALKNLTPDR